MENQNVKRGRGRPRKLSDQQRIKNKTTYMLNTPKYPFTSWQKLSSQDFETYQK